MSGGVGSRRCILRLIAAVLLAAGLAPAAASTFSLAPIRVNLSSTHRIGVVTLHNDGDAPVTVQIRACAWSQRRGEDRYVTAIDLITAPPMFVVAPHAEQIVRIALRREEQSPLERAYRVFFEEVPEPGNGPVNGLRVYLRIGIPVFVAPAAPHPGVLVWRARALRPGTLAVSATNEGREHVQVINFDLRIGARSEPLAVAASRYVLPGHTVTWQVPLPAGARPRAPLRINGLTDQGAITSNVPYSAS